MECRRTAVAGGVLRSPPSASAAPLTVAANAGVTRQRGLLRHSRLYDCDDHVVDEYNNNKNNSNAYATTINNTTQLVDELEQLRTDNFQLRLRVYNAERRVDRLSAAALGRDREKRSDTDTDGDDTTDGGSSGHGDTDRCDNAAAKATAEAAVRTIHDLLTVNRRLLALLAATVSAKAVSVSADDKRRWRRLRKHIDKYSADGTKEEKTNELDEDDDEFHDVSATDSETSCKSRAVSAVERSATRQNVLRSPPPPPAPSSSAAPPETTGEDDEGAGSEVSRLRGRCRRLERSLQQLVNTELWARNRQIGKLEQQKYVTQAAAQRDRKPTEAVPADAAAPLQQHYLQQFRSKAASTVPMPAATRGILVKRLPAETPAATASTAATASQNHRQSPTAVTTITTPPPVLPDYSEVNFFFSCDEEDDDDDDDEDSSAEMNTSSSEEQTANSDDRGGDQEPVRLTAIAAPPASSASARKRHCRPHHRQLQQPIKSVGDTATVTTTSSSSAESAAADEAGDLNGDGAVATTAATRGRTVSGGGGGGGLHRRRRCRPPRRCSTCGRCSGVVDAEPAADHSRPPSVTDAQVQCGDGNVATDRGSSSGSDVGEPQLQLLRRELDARRRENGRLYDMLLRLQRETQSGDRGKGDGGPRNPSPDLSDSDLSGSPEPHQRAARAVRGRIDDLLPPLLSVRSISDDDDDDNGGGGEGHQRDQPDGAEQQQQQQLMLLTRLRERIVAYERRELNGGDDRVAGAVQSAQPRPEDTSNDAVRRMDRTDLVNVALPRVVERLRQALVPLLQHRQENAVASPAGVRSSNVGDGARPSSPSEER